jgi:NAD(P)-dependent dehydrogenase (short-subunit alcohol dehydrogenase family)
MGRLGYPEDVADLVCFFASEHAGFTTGQEIFVTGGGHPLTSRGVG